jgi:hypothetical protein
MIQPLFELVAHWEVTASASLDYLLSVELWQRLVALATSELVDTLGSTEAL